MRDLVDADGVPMGGSRFARILRFALLSVLIGCCYTSGAGAGLSEDVVEAPRGRLHYVASIKRVGSQDHVCTGVLVSRWHVVTAAHCVDPVSAYSAGRRPLVQLGATSVTGVGDRDLELMVTEWSVIHPGWFPLKSQASGFDIAVLKLPKPSKHAVPKVLVDHFALRSGQKLAALGWGVGRDGPQLGGEIYTTLKIEFQEFLSTERCNLPTLRDGGVEENTFCGFNAERRASCIVDSGSPLMLLDAPGHDVAKGSPELDFLVGFNSNGDPCGKEGKPDVYVDTRSHALWIKAQMSSGTDAPGALQDEL